MRIILFVLVLSACTRDVLVKAPDVCGQPCYGGKTTNAGVGICTFGYWQCDSNGDATCINWVAPRPKTCNGLDNNCDGFVDQTPSPEVCNGVDDDCDGVVDNITSTPQPCYTGPDKTIGNGDCNYGHYSCVGGVMWCIGQRLPQVEVCDGKDNNCDGEIDEGLTANKSYDFVFALDTSNSMLGVIENVKMSIANFSSKYAANPKYRFALITVPDMDVARDGKVTLYQNFADATVFVSAVNKQSTGASGIEVTIDAVNDVADYDKNPLGLHWNPGSVRTLILFGDEEPQSNIDRKLSTSNVAIKVNNTNPPLLPILFVSNRDAADYAVMLGHSGGKTLDIHDTQSVIQSELDGILQNASCR